VAFAAGFFGATGFFAGFADAADFDVALRALPAAGRAGAFDAFARVAATGLLFAIPKSIL
jgi:hypothetical protein